MPHLEAAFSYQVETPAPLSHRVKAKLEDFTPAPTSEVLAINGDEARSQRLSRFSGALHDLRWDMYLVLAVAEGAVSDLLRKTIENDRLYFRKLVLAPDDTPHFDRLPFVRIEPGQELVLFQESEFLEQLKARLSPAAVERLGEAFFANGTADAAGLFGLTRGGGGDEDSGA